jgi:predicted GIY-YIG superfamily endonuclease
MLHRACRLPLTEEDRQKEIQIIKQIARKNNYNPSIIDKMKKNIERKLRNTEKLKSITTLNQENEKPNRKYVTFNYTGKQSQKIANKFKKYNVSVAYKTSNNLSKFLHHSTEDESKFEKSGIYKIQCNDCNSYYIGQTQNFRKRFKEHISAWKNNKPDRSNVAKHLIQNNHTVHEIEKCLTIMKICPKGRNMSAWEELFIHKEKSKNQDFLINEQLNFESEIIYKHIRKSNK